LPEETQLAPVFSFTSLPGSRSPAYLAVGNFYGVVHYEGRYDALLPTVLSYDKQQSMFAAQGILPMVQQEIRDAKWLNYTNGSKLLVLAVNNGPLIFLKPNIQP
jgi:hypothetical protein